MPRKKKIKSEEIVKTEPKKDTQEDLVFDEIIVDDHIFDEYDEFEKYAMEAEYYPTPELNETQKEVKKKLTEFLEEADCRIMDIEELADGADIGEKSYIDAIIVDSDYYQLHLRINKVRDTLMDLSSYLQLDISF